MKDARDLIYIHVSKGLRHLKIARGRVLSSC